MKKRKTIGISIWLLMFVLSLVLLFIIPKEYSYSIWITVGFDVIGFVSQLLLWIVLFKGITDTDDAFYVVPTMTVSSVYLGIQLVVCIFIAVLGSKVSIRTTLILNIVLLILAWVIILLLAFGRDHAQKVDSRQKNHHTAL